MILCHKPITETMKVKFAMTCLEGLWYRKQMRVLITINFNITLHIPFSLKISL